MKVSANRRQKPPDTPGDIPGPQHEGLEMTDYKPRLFSTDEEILRIGKGLLDCTLPKADWTHEAHLAACTWIVRDRPDIAAEREMPTIISRYNESVGGVNSDTEGYHETITQVFIKAVRNHLAERPTDDNLLECINTLLDSSRGRRDWPLRFYSRERLFSVQARREFVLPDMAEFDLE